MKSIFFLLIVWFFEKILAYLWILLKLVLLKILLQSALYRGEMFHKNRVIQKNTRYQESRQRLADKYITYITDIRRASADSMYISEPTRYTQGFRETQNWASWS